MDILLLDKACYKFAQIAENDEPEISSEEENLFITRPVETVSTVQTSEIPVSPQENTSIPAEKQALINKLKPYNRSGKPLDDNFWLAFIDMCERLGVAPENLAKVIRGESGFDPNPPRRTRTWAKGLNQMIRFVAMKGLGMTQEEWDRYHLLPAIQQLPWVEKYFRRQNVRGASAIDIYAKNFGGFNNPDGSLYASKAYIESHPQRDQFKNPDYQDLAYRENRALDRDNKGYIAKSDLGRLIGS